MYKDTPIFQSKLISDMINNYTIERFTLDLYYYNNLNRCPISSVITKTIRYKYGL